MSQTPMTNVERVRVAFMRDRMVQILPMSALRALVNSEDPNIRIAYRDAEYVPCESQWYTHADIMRHGYTTRALVEWSIR